jgi:hypothetical protein
MPAPSTGNPEVLGKRPTTPDRRGRAPTILQPLSTQGDAITNHTYRVIEISEPHPTESTRRSATVWHERRRPHADSTGSKCNRFVATSKTEPLHTFQITIKVGSGTVEAGRKVIIAQRLKLSRCAGTSPPATGILTPRCDQAGGRCTTSGRNRTTDRHRLNCLSSPESRSTTST